MLEDIKDRFTSRKFLLTVLGLILVTLDVAEATEIVIVLGPFIGLEGISDSVERARRL